MQKIIFFIAFASVTLILSCMKEPSQIPEDRPFGYQFAGVWRTDSTSINGINATDDFNASMWLSIDSFLSDDGAVRQYCFSGIIEEKLKSQFNYWETEKIEGQVRFFDELPPNPWEPSIRKFEIFYDQQVPCGDGATCNEEITLKHMTINESTQNMMEVQVESDSIKWFYRFVRQ